MPVVVAELYYYKAVLLIARDELEEAHETMERSFELMNALVDQLTEDGEDGEDPGTESGGGSC